MSSERECPQCGTINAADAQFCAKCGRKFEITAGTAPIGDGSYAQQSYNQHSLHHNKLVRCKNDQMVGGVCAGFARYIGWDVGLVRILTAFAMLASGSAVFWLYIIAWIILPEEECVQA